jgi:hypothetical protein
MVLTLLGLQESMKFGTQELVLRSEIVISAKDWIDSRNMCFTSDLVNVNRGYSVHIGILLTVKCST